MSAEKDVSILNIYPVTFSLINIHFVQSEGDGPKLIEFKTKVRSSLIKRMNVSEIFILLYIIFIHSLL